MSLNRPHTVGIAYLFQRKSGFPTNVSLRSGPVVQVRDWDDLTTVWHVWLADEYLVPRECETIVDLGANIGAFALWAAVRCPRATIYSVEPFPETYDILFEHVRKNGLESRVRCFQKAIGDHDGDVWFDATPGKRSYCRNIVSESTPVERIRVPGLTLASFLDQCGLPTVDCIKMDIEGGEHALFASADVETLRRAKVFTMEYHEPEKSKLIWERLKQAGFEQIAMRPNGWSGLATYRRVGE